MEVSDHAGNVRTYSPAELGSLGFSSSFEIFTSSYRPTNDSDILQGSNSADALHGYAGNDYIRGFDGDDTLHGGSGEDTLEGGAGGDTYYVDSAGDVVVEIPSDASFVPMLMADRVYTSVSYTLADYVEWLDALGSDAINLTGNGIGNKIVGNAANNVIDGRDGNDGLYGYGGNDTLIGGTGADHMLGGAGDDVYFVDDAGDFVIEAAGEGIDTVITNLATYMLPFDVEWLTVSGLSRGTLTGNELNNQIRGNAGANKIYGWDGADRLFGGSGNDTLMGGKGKDVFGFNSKLGTSKTDRKVNFDKITDFNVKDDSVWLDNAIFKKLGSKGSELSPAKLKKSYFTVGSEAKDKNDYIVYDKRTGILSYDADGSGRAKAIEFAQISKNLKLTYADFFVI